MKLLGVSRQGQQSIKLREVSFGGWGPGGDCMPVQPAQGSDGVKLLREQRDYREERVRETWVAKGVSCLGGTK